MSHLCPVQGLGTAGLLRARFPPKSVALQSLCQIANICVCACVSFFFFFFFQYGLFLCGLIIYSLRFICFGAS